MNGAKQNAKYHTEAPEGTSAKKYPRAFFLLGIFGTFVIIVISFVLLPSCVEELGRPTDSQEEDVSLPFSTISKGTFSGCTTKQNLVIKTQEQWVKLWKKHTSTRMPQTPTPKVDFTKQMILAIFGGQKPTGGFAVEIVKVEKGRDKIKVFFKETVPPPDALVSQVFTQLYHIIKVEKSDLPVTFEVKEDRR